MFQTTSQYMVAPVAPYFFFPDPALTLSESKELLEACRSRMLESGTGIWSKTMGTEAIGDPPNMGILVAFFENGGSFPVSRNLLMRAEMPQLTTGHFSRGEPKCRWLESREILRYNINTHMLHCAGIFCSTVICPKHHPVFWSKYTIHGASGT